MVAKKTEQVKMISVKEIAELVAKTFESHGFDINMLTSSIEMQIFRNGSKPTGTIVVNFGERRSEGQAGFSQSKVTPSFEVHSREFYENETIFTNPWDIWDAEIKADVGIRLRVDYEHHGGGSNGYTRDYQIIEGHKHTAKKPNRYLSSYRD